MHKNREEITITLTADEAVVLDALLARLQDERSLAIDHPAEFRALWNLHASLERVLVAPFKPDYQQHLASARERLTDTRG